MDIDAEIRKVKQILTGRFSNPVDKAYWEHRLRELEVKKSTQKNNEDYFKSMRKYNTYRYGTGDSLRD